MLLSTVFWNNPAGGAWETTGNWVDDRGVHRLPGPADDVVISGVNAGATVTHGGVTDTIATLTSSNADPYTLALTGGSLDLAGTSPSLLNANTHVVSGNTLRVRSGVTVEGPVTAGNSSISRLVTPGAAPPGPVCVTFSGSASGHMGFNVKFEWRGMCFRLGVTFDWDSGTAPGSNAAQLDLEDGSSLDIESGASVKMSGNGAIVNSDGNAGRITVESGGLFQKDPGAGTARVDLPLDNAGTVDVGAGALDLRAGGQSSGNFTVDKGGTLQFSGGTPLLTSDSSVRGDGTVVVSGTLAQILGSYDVPNTAIYGGTLVLGGDVHAGQAILVQGVFGGNATLQSADSFRNGGAITLQSADGFWSANLRVGRDGTGTLTNTDTGTLNMNAGNGGGRTLTGSLNNAGTVNVDFSTTFQNGIFTNAGDFTIAPGQTLTVSNSPAFNQDDGTLTCAGTYSQAGGAFNFNGGRPAGNPLQLGGVVLTIGPDAREAAAFTVYGDSTLRGDVHEHQSIVVQGVFGSTATLTAADSFRNAGAITLQSADFFWSANLTVGQGGTGTLTNTGTLNVNAGNGGGRTLTGSLNNAGTVTVNLSTTFSNGVYTNTGTFNIRSGGTLSISNGSLTNLVNGGILYRGTYVVGGRFQFPNAAIIRNDATIVLDGAGVIVDQSNVNALGHLAFNTTTGSLTLRNGSNLATAADLSNTGDLTVGVASTLRVGGSYSQGPLAGLTIQIDGPPDSGLVGQLLVGGPAALDGTLTAVFQDDYLATDGDSFQILTASSVVGTFATVNVVNLDPNFHLTVAYDPGDVTLTVTATPSPRPPGGGDGGTNAGRSAAFLALAAEADEAGPGPARACGGTPGPTPVDAFFGAPGGVAGELLPGAATLGLL
jgi:hypothetical protein